MKLTGKAKELFEKWFNENVSYSVPCSNHGCKQAEFEDFKDLPQSMQWGVYQDWADSLGYVVNTYCNASGYLWEIHKNAENGGTGMFDSGYSGPNSGGCWDTLPEARTAAIKKLDELITIPLGGNGLKE